MNYDSIYRYLRIKNKRGLDPLSVRRRVYWKDSTYVGFIIDVTVEGNSIITIFCMFTLLILSLNVSQWIPEPLHLLVMCGGETT